MSDYLAFMDIDYYGAPHHNNHAGTETSNWDWHHHGSLSKKRQKFWWDYDVFESMMAFSVTFCRVHNLKYTGIFLDLFLNYAFCPVRNLVSFHLFKTTAIKLDRIIAMAKLHIANTPDGTFPFNKVITK